MGCGRWRHNVIGRTAGIIVPHSLCVLCSIVLYPMNEPHASLALAPTIGIVGVLYFSHAIKLLFAECSFNCKPLWVHRQRTPRGTVAQGGGGMRQKNMRTVSYVNVQMHRDPDSLHLLRAHPRRHWPARQACALQSGVGHCLGDVASSIFQTIPASMLSLGCPVCHGRFHCRLYQFNSLRLPPPHPKYDVFISSLSCTRP